MSTHTTQTPSPANASSAGEQPPETKPTVLPDGTTVLGDQQGGVIDVEYRLRTPGPDARKRQRDEFPLLVAEQMRNRAERNDDPAPTDAEITAEVTERLSEAAARRLGIQAALAEVAPESASWPADEVDRGIETAAVLRLPLMVWARLRLLLYTSGPKQLPMWRRLAVATSLHMGFCCERPRASRVLEEFCHDNRFLSWMHQWPGHPPVYRRRGERWELSAFHKQVKKVLGPANSFKMWQAINRQLLLQLLGEHSTDGKKGGQFANFPDALKYIIVDGFLIQADLPQSKPVSEAHARMIRGEARKRCGFITYRNKAGVSKKCHGYKWMQLSLLKLGGLVLHGKLFPANVDERAAVLELLAEAFELWPELRLQKDIFLIGDALYDMSEQFAYDLTFRWGIHGVFPRGGTIGSKYEFSGTDGVPLCKCGELAALDEATDFPTPWSRHQKNCAGPGQYIFNKRGQVEDAARIRWRCAKRPGMRCDYAKATYLRENPRLYTYLPQAGNHPRAALRAALLCYRNVVESSFSGLKDMALAGTSQDRPRWAGDDQMDHLVWMNVVTMTGRRLVHANGLYEQVSEEAEREGLLRAATPLSATHALFTPREWTAREEALKRFAQAPPGWAELDPDTDEFHDANPEQ